MITNKKINIQDLINFLCQSKVNKNMFNRRKSYFKHKFLRTSLSLEDIRPNKQHEIVVIIKYV